MSKRKASSRPAHSLPTPRQVEGPYFLLDSPRQTHMSPKGAVGALHRLSGLVLSTDRQPIPQATIHVWLADPDGVYDNQDANGNPVDLPPAQHKYRGRIGADSLLANGAYSFSFLRPGNYPIPEEGLEARPAHVHVLVEAEGYSELITQLYFQDDPYNLLDIKRPGFFKPELVVHFMPLTTFLFETAQVGVFNFVLRKLLPKPNRKPAREKNIQKLIDSVLYLSSVTYGSLEGNMNEIALAYEGAAYLGIGMDRFTQMINQKLASGNGSRMRIFLQNKKITGRDTSLRSGHWRFHKAKFVVSVKHGSSAPEIESATLRYSTLEAL